METLSSFIRQWTWCAASRDQFYSSKNGFLHLNRDWLYLLESKKRKSNHSWDLTNNYGFRAPHDLLRAPEKFLPAGIQRCPRWRSDLPGWWDSGDQSWWQIHREWRRFLIVCTFRAGNPRTALWFHHPHFQTLPGSAEEKEKFMYIFSMYVYISIISMYVHIQKNT